MKHSKELVAANPHLATTAAAQPGMSSNAATANHRFFAKAENKANDVVLESQNSYRPV